MTFQWITPGVELDDTERTELGLDQTFADRAAAEAWCGFAWPDLDAAGIAEVTLTEDGAPVFTMGLSA